MVQKNVGALLGLVLTLGSMTPVAASSSCSWQVYMPPNAAGYQSLYAVDPISSNDVWAAGFFITDSGDQHMLFEHFDGTQWSTVKAPKNTLFSPVIYGRSHFASNDVWAVGVASDDPITMHWNGKTWKIVPNPAGSVGGQLTAVVRVGGFMYAAGFTSPVAPLVERFDGTQWVNDNAYKPASGLSILQAVAGTSPNDIWAGGYYKNGSALTEARPEDQRLGPSSDQRWNLHRFNVRTLKSRGLGDWATDLGWLRGTMGWQEMAERQLPAKRCHSLAGQRYCEHGLYVDLRNVR